jgi:Ca2+-binding EF-hand superfamily protein
MARNYKEIDAEEELLEAFRVLDKQNTGIIGF